MKFEWDPRKNAANRRKHGVGFRKATTVFGNPLAVTFPDASFDVRASLSDHRCIGQRTHVSSGPYRKRRDNPNHQRKIGYAPREKFL